MNTGIYSLASIVLGAIFLILYDIRHAEANANSTSAAAAAAINGTGTVNVHFTIPRSLKNHAISGFMIKQQMVILAIVERMTAGIKENAVWTTSCPVVKPSAFKIP